MKIESKALPDGILDTDSLVLYHDGSVTALSRDIAFREEDLEWVEKHCLACFYKKIVPLFVTGTLKATGEKIHYLVHVQPKLTVPVIEKWGEERPSPVIPFISTIHSAMNNEWNEYLLRVADVLGVDHSGIDTQIVAKPDTGSDEYDKEVGSRSKSKKTSPISGEFVYYHIEDREGASNYRDGGLLTIADLRDDVPLFLCENPQEWFPHYLPSEKRSEFTVYEVRFSVPSYIVFKDDTKKNYFKNAYFGMFRTREVDGKYITELTDKFKKIHEGSSVDLFYMKTERELSECFLVNSSKRVTSITPLSK